MKAGWVTQEIWEGISEEVTLKLRKRGKQMINRRRKSLQAFDGALSGPQSCLPSPLCAWNSQQAWLYAKGPFLFPKLFSLCSHLNCPQYPRYSLSFLFDQYQRESVLEDFLEPKCWGGCGALLTPPEEL